LSIALLIIRGVTAQPDQPCESCLPQGITFKNQHHIDLFQTTYPNCTEIEGSVTISGNGILNLYGLSVLTSIGGNLSIGSNSSLTSLTGLENLTSIEGSFWIGANSSLTSLTGLENLTSIGDYLTIFTNNSLASLNGLDNLTTIGGELRIINNNSLSTCNAQWLCDYLAAPAGVVEIYQNAAGCESVMEVASACGGLPCLPYGNYRFYSQTDIDIFQAAFSNCSELQGDVIISGVDISGLSGLDIVNSIGGLLYITKTSLTSLNGLENLTAIGGMLQLGCWIEISGNSSLTSLKGLDSLTSIGGDIGVSNNSSLTSLSGIDNIDAGSITNLYIHDNTSLSTCHVQSICEYLIMPNGWTQISGNATGCNSFEQVLSACMVGVDESSAAYITPTHGTTNNNGLVEVGFWGIYYTRG